jgi:tetratricopeptide (TPR) repeat protein
MKTLRITFVLLSLAQFTAGELTPVNSSLNQGQKADSQVSEKQAEAGRLSSQVIRLFGEGKFDEALPIASRVLEMSENVFGPNDVAVANAASNLAEIYIAKGSSQKAEPFLLRAIQINDQVRKPADPILVKTLERYMCILNNREQDDKLKEFVKGRLPVLGGSTEPDRFWGALWLVTKAIRMPRPAYPQGAQGRSERILVEVVLNEQGKVIRAQSMCGGSALLINVSVASAKQSEFQPVLIGGKPIRVIGYLLYRFVAQ